VQKRYNDTKKLLKTLPW